MKTLYQILLAWALAVASTMADENSVTSCPIKTSIWRDGGSRSIEIPACGDLPAIVIYCDNRINTSTPQEYYLKDDFYKESGKPMKVVDVLRALGQAESVLHSKYGVEFLYHVAMNPLILNGNLPTEEYLKRFSDDKFMERIDVSQVLSLIQNYRALHRTEQAGTEQPATAPQLKSEGNEKPKPESEVRPR